MKTSMTETKELTLMPMTERGIENAPKNLKESLERAVAFMKENTGSYGMYEDDKGCPCLIGSYFSKDQRAWIIAEDINDLPIYNAVRKIGHQNLLDLTAMNADQCYVIQNYFDTGRRHELTRMIQEVLKGDRETINGIRFTL